MRRTCTADECDPGVERIVWDGDRVLMEFRADATTGQYTTGSAYYGRITYTNVIGGAVDRPLDVMKDTTMLAPYLDWRGQFAGGTDSGGTDCNPPSTGNWCTNVQFPGDTWGVYLNETEPVPPRPIYFGSVLRGGVDASGLLYRRNRYYDPATGQFTQEDPIGIAGGLNLYGYANGDPIGMRDPFGLCPDPDDLICQLFEAGFTALGASVGFLGGGGLGAVEIAGSGGLLAPAAVATVAGSTAAGAAAGKATGQFLSNIFFSKSHDGLRKKPGSQGQFKGRDALRRENRMMRDVVKELQLNRDQRTRLHREISGQGLDYHEIVETARGLFGGRT